MKEVQLKEDIYVCDNKNMLDTIVLLPEQKEIEDIGRVVREASLMLIVGTILFDYCAPKSLQYVLFHTYN